MKLIGDRYATFRDHDLLVKSEDLVVEGRLPVRCYREALAVWLGNRLGLTIPCTELVVDPDLGRLVIQHWLERARPASDELVHGTHGTATSTRILVLDLLVGNTDRHLRNLLELDGTLVPIDFNVAFAFAGEATRSESPDNTIMRWFGTHGVVALRPDAWPHFEVELARFEHLLSESYLRWCITRIPDPFLDPAERQRLEVGLLTRRAAVGPWIRDWWRRTVEPLHRFQEAT